MRTKKLFMVAGMFIAGMWLAGWTMAGDDATYDPVGKNLHIPKVDFLDAQGNTVRSYEAFLKKKGRGWDFRLSGVSVAGTSSNLSGLWEFQFNHSIGCGYDTTNWYWVTNTTPVEETLNFTLNQSSNDTVSGSCLTNGMDIMLGGTVVEDYFSFTMLIGYSDAHVALVSGETFIQGNSMQGVYLYDATNRLVIGGGSITATKK